MQTIVHTELRATCRYIKSSLRQQSGSRTTSRRGFHNQFGTQARSTARGGGRTSSTKLSRVGDESNKHELDNEKPRGEDTSEPPAQEEAAQGGPFTPGGSFPPGGFPPGYPGGYPNGSVPGQDGDALGFYGSSMRRRLRMKRQAEDQEKERAPFQAPAWYVDSNLQCFGTGRLDPEQGPSISQHGNDSEKPALFSKGPSSPFMEDFALSPQKPGSLRSDGKESRYYSNAEQYDELHNTFRGLLQGTEDSDFTLRSHLLLHYAGSDGDLYLDRLVEDLARQYGCDLMTLDGQDIAELVTSAGAGTEIAEQARMFSYELFAEVYGEPSSSDSGISESFEFEDEEEDDDGSGPLGDDSSPPTHFGIPVVVPKFAAAFGRSRPGNSGGNTMDAREFLSMFDGSKGKDKAEELAQITSGVVEGLITAFQKKRTENPDHQAMKQETKLRHSIPENTTIIHIKDLRAIQQTNFGGAFLQQLFLNVARRRSSKECIMLVGTDSSHEEDAIYDRRRIDEFQKGDGAQISQNLLLTPVTPNNSARMAFAADRKMRVATINLRHLWTMLRVRKPAIVSKLQPGFWFQAYQGDVFLNLAKHDVLELGHKVWSYPFTHRLATYIAGFEREPIDADRAVISHAIQRLKESDKSKVHWVDAVRKKAAENEKGSADDVLVKDRIQKIKSKATTHEKKLLSGVIEPKNIRTTFNDVHVPVETIDSLQTLTTLSLIRPEAFKYGVLASDRIPGLLLYGPPGTGKTLLAKAVAKESGATVLEVSAADLNNMYVGEGEKNVKALFSLARRLSPCVVFLDEADAMFSARAQQGRRVSHREMINQFLKEWDGMNNDAGSAFIMVATNRPMDLDDAVLRRLPRRLLVDLPTESDREEILKIHLRSEQLAADVDLAQIAKKTPFHSGSDLKNLAVAAALRCVREENDLAKQHDQTNSDEPYKYVETRTLTAAHFDKAMEEITASISEDMDSLRDIKKFDEQYGDKRGKKRRSPKWGFKTEKEANEVLDTVKVRS